MKFPAPALEETLKKMVDELGKYNERPGAA